MILFIVVVIIIIIIVIKTLHVAQVANTQQLQQCVYPRNMVCFRHIIVNTLHKVDNKYNNNNNNNNNRLSPFPLHEVVWGEEV